MEVQVGGVSSTGLGYGDLACGHDIHPQAFLGHELHYRGVNEGL